MMMRMTMMMITMMKMESLRTMRRVQKQLKRIYQRKLMSYWMNLKLPLKKSSPLKPNPMSTKTRQTCLRLLRVSWR